MTAGIAVMAVACTPVPVATGTGTETGPAEKQSPRVGAAEDVTAELGPWTLTGMVFTPEALPPTAMRLVKVTPAVPLAKARAQWAKLARDGKPPKGAKATSAHVLASLLYEQAAADPSKKAEPLTEANAVIAALHGGAADSSADVVTLEMGAALAFAADDRAAAQPYLEELVRRFPADKVTTNARAQLAFVHLRARKNADAAMVITGAEETPEIHYVTAWLRFRQGDNAGAVAALTKAIEKWPDPAWLEPLTRDYLLMAARGGVNATDASLVLSTLYPDPATRFLVFHELSRSYAFAGRPAEASAAIELALGVAGGTLPPKDAEALKAESAALGKLASGKPPVEAEKGDAVAYGHAAKATVDARRQEIQACYEQPLQGDPTLAGAMTLTLEVDPGGSVVGATSEPPDGEAGVAAVARCAVARVRTWRFPARPGGGVARLAAAFTLAPAK
ncbi:MAG TPA: AgmX/PglI C-terminal domain-containing protein [Kofleriaceae bacterium]|nr:AgmX/PglI C-terminal domain-containing protein [Kofleriaceae bacterium]